MKEQGECKEGETNLSLSSKQMCVCDTRWFVACKQIHKYKKLGKNQWNTMLFLVHWIGNI